MEKLALIFKDGNLFNDLLPRIIPALKAVGLFIGNTLLLGKKYQTFFGDVFDYNQSEGSTGRTNF